MEVQTQVGQRPVDREAMLLALAALVGECPEDVAAAKAQLRKALGLAAHVKVEISHQVPEAPMVVNAADFDFVGDDALETALAGRMPRRVSPPSALSAPYGKADAPGPEATSIPSILAVAHWTGGFARADD